MAENAKLIARAYVREYRDSGHTVAYVEWSDGSRTEGPEHSAHIAALFERAKRDSVPVDREIW